MVTHASFRTEDGRWLYPDEVVVAADGRATVAVSGEPVIVGRVEAMSKSKRNTVDPAAIIDRFGADTARWFILSDNPPERDVEWTEAGVTGAYRFTQRLFRLAEAVGDSRSAVPETLAPAALALRRATHRCIAAVTEALESFAFNVAVARIHELANALADAERSTAVGVQPGLDWAREECVEILTILISPMMPHLAEALHALRNPAGDDLVADLAWPEADPGLVALQTVKIAVQVMGKLRATIELAPGAAAESVLEAARAEPNVARLLAGKRVAKTIHVPDRIVNFVLAD
jgi:leucyl-tRNA synthetase